MSDGFSKATGNASGEKFLGEERDLIEHGLSQNHREKKNHITHIPLGKLLGGKCR
jgi:hypothetical protein